MIKNKFLYIFLPILSIYIFLSWKGTLDYWFFKGYEAFWLPGSKSDIFSFTALYRSHAFIYFFAHKFFGWSAKHWYLIGIFTHILATFSVLFLVKSMLDKLKEKKFNNYFLFFVGIIFGVNITFHDVIAWGSFNAYYGILMISICASLILYNKYQENNEIFYIFLANIFFIIGLINRETVIIVIPLIILINFIFTQKYKFNFKNIFYNKFLLSFIIIFFIYLFFRFQIGGISGDSIDENVKLRHSLLNEGSYVELFFRIIATSLRNFTTLIIPYEIVINLKQDFYTHNANIHHLAYVIFGIISFFPFLLYATYILYNGHRRNIDNNKLYLFGLSWIIICLALLGLAIPNTDNELARDFVWNNRRYNYFAYIGILFIAIHFLNKINYKNKKKSIILIFTICLSIYYFIEVQKIQKKIYENEHKIVKNFIYDFKNFYPNFSNSDNLLYNHPTSNKVGDYVFELGLMFSAHYPKSKDGVVFNLPYNDIFFDLINKGDQDIKNLKYIYFDENTGLIDISKIFKKYFFDIKTIISKKNEINIKENTIPIEIPMDIELNLSKIKFKNDKKTFQSINWFLLNSSLSVKNKMIFYTGFEHPYYKVDYLSDGNLNSKYKWYSNGLENFIEIHLNKNKSINGLWLFTDEKNRTPTGYNIEIYDEINQKWQIIHKIENDERLEKKIFFKKSYNVNKLRFNITSTAIGHNAIINEMGIILVEDKKIFEKNSLIDIFKSEYQKIYDNKAWLKLSWNRSDKQRFQHYYKIDLTKNRYVVNLRDSEFFLNKKNYYFKTFYDEVTFDLPKSIKYDIDSMKLKKKYNFYNEN